MKTITECKQMMIDIMENKTFKASEVSELLSATHTHICKSNSNSLLLTLKSITSDETLLSPISKVDFTCLAEDVFSALFSTTKVNLTKYNYIPWLYYLRTGIKNSEVFNTNLKGSVIKLPDNIYIMPPSEEISKIVANTNVKNAVLVYGTLFYILGK